MVSHASNMRVSVGMCLAIRVSGVFAHLSGAHWSSVSASGNLGVCLSSAWLCPSFTLRCVGSSPTLPTLSLCPSFSAAPLLGTLLGSARQCLSQAKLWLRWLSVGSTCVRIILSPGGRVSPCLEASTLVGPSLPPSLLPSLFLKLSSSFLPLSMPPLHSANASSSSLCPWLSLLQSVLGELFGFV